MKLYRCTPHTSDENEWKVRQPRPKQFFNYHTDRRPSKVGQPRSRRHHNPSPGNTLPTKSLQQKEFQLLEKSSHDRDYPPDAEHIIIWSIRGGIKLIDGIREGKNARSYFVSNVGEGGAGGRGQHGTKTGQGTKWGGVRAAQKNEKLLYRKHPQVVGELMFNLT